MVAKRVPAAAKPKPRPRKKVSVEAREAEASDDGFVNLEQCGVKLRIPVGKKVPVSAIDAYRRAGSSDAEEKKWAIYDGTREMLGEEQWKALSDAGMTGEDLDELAAKLSEATGN